MPKRSKDYMRARRQQILDAATRCGVRHGWRRVTIDDVAARAGMSKGAVYVHFRSKDALLRGLLERGLEAIEAIRECTSLEDFRRALSVELGVHEGPRGRQLAIRQLELVIESTRDAALRDVFRRATVRLLENIAAVVQRFRPELAPRECSDIALTLMILLHGARSVRAQSDLPGDSEWQGVLERQIDLLLGPARIEPQATARRTNAVPRVRARRAR